MVRKECGRYELAKKRYDEEVWDILNKFRSEISRSRWLASEHAYEKLDSLYDYVVHDLDMQISNIIGADHPMLDRQDNC